jgi:hypothetical protein
MYSACSQKPSSVKLYDCPAVAGTVKLLLPGL